MGLAIKFAPTYKIEVAGVNNTETFRQRLISLTVNSSIEEQSDHLTFALDDSNEFKRLKVPEKNDEIKLWMGYEGNLQPMGTFIVDSVKLSGSAGSTDQYSIDAKAIDTLSKLFDKEYQVWKGKKEGEKIKLVTLWAILPENMDLSPQSARC